MAVIRGDFVHFQIRDARGPRTCRISQAALLLPERLNMEDGSPEIVLSIFIKHRREIERMACDGFRKSRRAQTHRHHYG